VLSYVQGKNRTTGDNLYNIMPLNAKRGADAAPGRLDNTAEVQLVARQDACLQVRNEVPTPATACSTCAAATSGSSCAWTSASRTCSNRFYDQPLGGAYLGQGASMTSTGMPWGVVVPGMGRSFNLALTVRI
jgi:iron complex outermembrane receptor protein